LTDPTGICFLSYRRIRADEARLLITALHERGIPTWQDLTDLPATPTEDELRRVLADPGTASAILFVTPEVEHSTVIREIEAPAILERHKTDDLFFVVPVAAGGLDYADVPRMLGPNVTLAHLPGWNIHRLAADPMDDAAASGIADIVLQQRLAAVHQSLPPDAVLRVAVNTRAPLPRTQGSALSIDLTHLFAGRLAPSSAWSNAILPGLASVVRTIRVKSPNRRIEITGQLAIPAAVAVGAALLSVSGMRAGWVQDQHSFGRPWERWDINRDREASGFTTEVRPQHPGAADVAVLVSAAADVNSDFAATAATLPPLRAVVSISPYGPPSGRTILTGGQALDVAHLTIDALRRARAQYHCRGAVHLFMAAPVGLAFMIGQLLNTLGTVHTYEHVPGRPIPYVPAAVLSPSM
jgi:SMODS-associated and fused to various effectors sensor domain